MSDHYFSANPGTEQKLRKVSFTVLDQEFEMQASSGTFSSSRLDPGTKVLLDQLSEVNGTVLDLGCGWGPISIAIGKLFPSTKVYALDVNQRSLEQTSENAKRFGLANVTPVTEREIPEGLEFDEIWSNPPIRVGKEVLHGLLKTWLPRLRPGGKAMLVVQKQLGADSLMKWIASEFPELEVTRVGNDKGYRVIKALKQN